MLSKSNNITLYFSDTGVVSPLLSVEKEFFNEAEVTAEVFLGEESIGCVGFDCDGEWFINDPEDEDLQVVLAHCQKLN